jgi:hypothetical protein
VIQPVVTSISSDEFRFQAMVKPAPMTDLGA